MRGTLDSVCSRLLEMGKGTCRRDATEEGKRRKSGKEIEEGVEIEIGFS